MAGTTGLEPATSCVTGMRSNQLNYVPLRKGLQTPDKRKVSHGPVQSAIRPPSGLFNRPMGGIRFERMTFPV